MYVVTGGAGFIGSAFVWKLNREGIHDILVVDNLGHGPKWKNLVPLRYAEYLNRETFLRLVAEDGVAAPVEAVIHLGACSSTTETDAEFLMENNYRYSKLVCQWALAKGARFINASSAATYGDGAQGFADDESALEALRPLNMYGYSKQLFDLWAKRAGLLNRIVCLKYFNVFGPNEHHKGDMMSVVCKAFHQIRETGGMKLFRSYRPDYPDGGQMRDFVYVKDCCEVMWWLCNQPEVNGVFNLGAGRARTWNDLAASVFAALNRAPNISYIDMPEAIRDKYQYFTQADMAKLAAAGCPVSMRGLEEATADYVTEHLMRADPYLDPARP